MISYLSDKNQDQSMFTAMDQSIFKESTSTDIYIIT